MTDRLYLEDDTVTTFEATVERALDDRLVLDRTHFYPTGGGQPHDTGTVRLADAAASADAARWRVVDVEMKDTVYHTVEPVENGAAATAVSEDGANAALPEPGTAVVGEVDVDRRAAHSRYHTAQHLLSALLLAEFDAQTTGNQLYHDHAHLDAAYDRFDETDLAWIETRLNEFVADERPVTSYTMDRADAEATLDTSEPGSTCCRTPSRSSGSSKSVRRAPTTPGPGSTPSPTTERRVPEPTSPTPPQSARSSSPAERRKGATRSAFGSRSPITSTPTTDALAGAPARSRSGV